MFDMISFFPEVLLPAVKRRAAEEFPGWGLMVLRRLDAVVLVTGFCLVHLSLLYFPYLVNVSYSSIHSSIIREFSTHS